MMPSADLGIVVVNHGYPDQLERNLVRIGQSVRPALVVVVDNFSGIAQREATTRLCAREGWTLLAPGLDLGFAAGANAGARLLRSRGCNLLLLLDPAVWIDAAGVLVLAAACVADPQRILGTNIRRQDGSICDGGGTVDIRRGHAPTRDGAAGSAPDGWLSASCLMIHGSLWDWLGGFDETYFLLWEDVDLSWRCVAAGGSLAVRGDIMVLRSAPDSVPAVGADLVRIYSNCRNRLAFAAEHLTRRQLLGWLLHSPGYAAEVLGAEGRRSPARRAGPMLAAAVRGTAAGSAVALRRLSGPAPDRPGGRRADERRSAPEKKTIG